MRDVVAEAEARFGAVHAAIHAAGVVDDAPLHSKERQSLEAVLRPKVAGAIALVEALRGRQLDFLACSRHTSAALGPAGQTDYVAANAFLNAYAHQLAAQGIPARCRAMGRVAARSEWPSLRSDRRRFLAARRSGIRCCSGEQTLAAARRCSARPSTRATQWVLDEHRVRGAEPVLPGTGFVEMARAAVVASGTLAADAAIELSDVTFTSPLVVPEKAPKFVETEVRREADGSFNLTIRSCGSTRPGRRARRPGEVAVVCRLDAAQRSTLRPSRRAATCAANPSDRASSCCRRKRLLGFGRRWKAVRSIAFGRGEALAHLELSDAHAADLDVFALHPALLDIATGCAFSLIDGAGGEGLFVPLSYGRVRIAGRLPTQLVSHVRLRPGSRDGIGVLDATSTDEHGRVAVEIEGYVVKAVDPQGPERRTKDGDGGVAARAMGRARYPPRRGIRSARTRARTAPGSAGADFADGSARDDRRAAAARATGRRPSASVDQRRPRRPARAATRRATKSSRSSRACGASCSASIPSGCRTGSSISAATR